MGWTVVALYAIWQGITLGILRFRNPELIAERAKLSQQNTKRWDPPILSIVGVATIVKYAVAGLDLRYGRTVVLPVWAQTTGIAVCVLGYALFSWANIANPFFCTVVRIQKERGHCVVATGPYQVLRHPGYAGMIASMLVTPFILGSLWALIPTGVEVAGYLIRTALEDSTLLKELDGYQDYARQTRYRLLPGIW
jgi:protein-S-isoprenylcysteine O-methyltransferase Ste14